jgi:hypothetical protein
VILGGKSCGVVADQLLLEVWSLLVLVVVMSVPVVALAVVLDPVLW